MTRKSFAALSDVEKDGFLEAVLMLKAEGTGLLSTYDRLVALHAAVMAVQTPQGGPVNMGHLEAGFLPWHRQFLLVFEQELSRVVPATTLPYWDWTEATTTRDVLFQDDFLSLTTPANPGPIASGYFAFDAPGTPNNATPEPAWWPIGLQGFRVVQGLDGGFGTALRRTIDPFEELAWESEVNAIFNTDSYEVFRQRVEAAPRMHNFCHNWMGGHMSDVLISPNDPIFFMHHANVDRLWSQWQADNHVGAGFYPNAGEPPGHNLDDLMWPWIGNAAGYQSMTIPEWALPTGVHDIEVRPSSVLDIAGLGYDYQ